MKNKYTTFSVLFLLLLFGQSCKKELPYPIDEVKRGVVIDVSRVANTDGVLYRGKTDGNYKVKFTIPENQGDYSFMSHAQLLAVLQGADGKITSQVITDNITGFPQEIQVNIADVYAKFGLTEPAAGEVLFFTANVVLKDGSIIPGWTDKIGFNNNAFAGWLVDGRAYSSNVRYAVVCALNLDDFVGKRIVTVDSWWEETPYNVEITKVSDTELSIAGLFKGEAENPLVIKVDPEDYSISFSKQVLVPSSGNWWSPARPTYNNFSLGEGTGVINACDWIISFSARATVDAGSFGIYQFEIRRQ